MSCFRVVEIIDPQCELVKLAAAIDWNVINQEFAKLFLISKGQTAKEQGLVAGQIHLQNADHMSNGAVIVRREKITYCQRFSGETFFQDRSSIDRSSLTLRSARIAAESVEWLLTWTIQTGKNSKAIDEDGARCLAVDTSVMEKKIACPTHIRLFEQAREGLVRLSLEAGLEPRRTYTRIAPRLALQLSHHAHAKQCWRVQTALRDLKKYRAKRIGDLRRQQDDIPEGSQQVQVIAKLALIHQPPASMR